MTINWKLEKRKLSSLKDYDKNPRFLSKDQFEHISHSLNTFGLIEKPIINPDGLIIGGHQRKNVLKKLGVKEVECWVPDRALDDREVEELNIRLNKNTGEWDFDILANEWNLKDLLDWGFTQEELALDNIESMDTSPASKCEILAKFENADDLREAEIEISAIINKFNSATYKVKVK